MSHVRRNEPFGLGPGAKLRISAPGIDSESRLEIWIGKIGEKGRERKSDPLYGEASFPTREPPCWNYPGCADVKGIASKFKNLVVAPHYDSDMCGQG